MQVHTGQQPGQQPGPRPIRARRRSGARWLEALAAAAALHLVGLALTGALVVDRHAAPAGELLETIGLTELLLPPSLLPLEQGVVVEIDPQTPDSPPPETAFVAARDSNPEQETRAADRTRSAPHAGGPVSQPAGALPRPAGLAGDGASAGATRASALDGSVKAVKTESGEGLLAGRSSATSGPSSPSPAAEAPDPPPSPGQTSLRPGAAAAASPGSQRPPPPEAPQATAALGRSPSPEPAAAAAGGGSEAPGEVPVRLPVANVGSGPAAARTLSPIDRMARPSPDETPNAADGLGVGARPGHPAGAEPRATETTVKAGPVSDAFLGTPGGVATGAASTHAPPGSATSDTPVPAAEAHPAAPAAAAPAAAAPSPAAPSPAAPSPASVRPAPPAPSPGAQIALVEGGVPERPRSDALANLPVAETDAMRARGSAYASFFNEVRDRLRDSWRSQQAYKEADPLGRYGRPSADSVVAVRLRADGRVERADLRLASGLAAVDKEAVAVFSRAQPFPRPPPQILDRTGGLDFQVRLTLDTGISHFVVQCRRLIGESWRPSRAFQLAGDHQRVTVARLLITNQGAVAQASLVTSAGIDFLDRGALAALSGGVRLPPPPADYRRTGALVPLLVEFYHRVKKPPELRVLHPNERETASLR